MHLPPPYAASLQNPVFSLLFHFPIRKCRPQAAVGSEEEERSHTITPLHWEGQWPAQHSYRTFLPNRSNSFHSSTATGAGKQAQTPLMRGCLYAQGELWVLHTHAAKDTTSGSSPALRPPGPCEPPATAEEANRREKPTAGRVSATLMHGTPGTKDPAESFCSWSSVKETRRRPSNESYFSAAQDAFCPSRQEAVADLAWHNYRQDCRAHQGFLRAWPSLFPI